MRGRNLWAYNLYMFADEEDSPMHYWRFHEDYLLGELLPLCDAS